MNKTTIDRVFVALEDVTEDVAARVRAGELIADVATPKAHLPQTVALRTYRTIDVYPGGRREVHDEKRLEVFKNGRWEPLTNQLLEKFDHEAYVARMEKAAERKAKSAAKANEAAAGIKVGDIFHSNWGYEQTNCEFYQVVAKSSQYVTVREIGQDYEETGYMSGNVTPRPGDFLESSFTIRDNMHGKRCKVSPWGSIRINDVISAWAWHGGSVGVSSYA